MDPLAHLLFAVAVSAAVVLGLAAGQWSPAIGLGIAWAFVTLMDMIWP